MTTMEDTALFCCPPRLNNNSVDQESQSVLNRTANESEDQTVCLSRLGEVNKLEPCGCENLISQKDLKTCETLLFSLRKLKTRKNTGTLLLRVGGDPWRPKNANA